MMKIGLFTFGGGYAMLSLLDREFVEKKKWLTKEEFLDMTAIAESTPGPIAINSATYIGYKKAGFLGSLVATLGMCIPSFMVIFLISIFLDDFMKYKIVINAFKGIQVCVVYLIFSSSIKLFKSLKKDLFSTFVFLLTVVAMVSFSILSVKFSSIFYILIFGIIGAVFYTFKINDEEK